MNTNFGYLFTMIILRNLKMYIFIVAPFQLILSVLFQLIQFEKILYAFFSSRFIRQGPALAFEHFCTI